jgi:hypothetical protein
MGLTQKRFLDDLIAVCDKNGIPLPSLTKDFYTAHVHHCNKTGYKLFNRKWREIIELACKYVDGTYEPDAMEGVVINVPPPPTPKAMFDFDLDETLNSPAPSRTSINPPRVHPFKVKSGELIFIVPDMHSPFLNRGWLVWVTQTILDAQKMGNKIHVIQSGDATDLYSLGNYEKNNNLAPKNEIDAALKPLKQFWKLMVDAGMTCYQLIGNHDIRGEKYVRRNAPQLLGFIPIAKEMLTFPGVYTADNERDCFLFEAPNDQVMVMHGYLNQSIDHAKKHGCNVVHSHLHRGGLNFFNGYFSLDAGFGGDPHEWVFAYTNSILRKEWNLTLGMVEVTMDGHLQPHLLRYFPI